MLHNTEQQSTRLQKLVDTNRAAGRLEAPKPKAGPEKRELVGMRLPLDEASQLKTLAADQERSVAWMARRLYLRGLASYLAEHGQQQ